MSDVAEAMDVTAVLDRLNAALRLQYRSALQYLLLSGGGRGPHAMAIGEQLWHYAQSEFADARLLISKVGALGGEPDVNVAEIRYQPGVGDSIRHLIDTEEKVLT